MAIGFNKNFDDQNNSTKPKSPPENNGETDDLTQTKSSAQSDDYDTSGNSGGFDAKKIAIVAVVLVIVIAVLFALKANLMKKSSPDTTNVPAATQSVDDETSSDTTSESDDEIGDNAETQATEEPNKYLQGDHDYSDSENNSVPEKVFSAGDYVKDLESEDVPAVYNVEKREYIVAHVSYTAKRAIIDDGMEMFWIDVDYKGKKYRVQCPYYYFKDLDETGICKVNIEVLYLEGGGQIISYMQVVDESYGE